MKVKCEYCGNYIDDADEKCSYCGAINENRKRTGTGVPKTIEELKEWYVNHNLPDENTTRFFIGKDYPGPKCYGIFKINSGDFIVYKNKADGTRVTRYVGKDEEYAVNELYLKLKEEILNQKTRNENLRSSINTQSVTPPKYKSIYADTYNARQLKTKKIIAVIVVIYCLLLISGYMTGGSHRRGYYNSGYDRDYYSSSYYDSSDYGSSSRSSWSSWSSSDWDSDSSWSSYDSWDSGWSDWDSDW